MCISIEGSAFRELASDEADGGDFNPGGRQLLLIEFFHPFSEGVYRVSILAGVSKNQKVGRLDRQAHFKWSDEKSQLQVCLCKIL